MLEECADHTRILRVEFLNVHEVLPSPPLVEPESAETGTLGQGVAPQGGGSARGACQGQNEQDGMHLT